MDTTAVDLDMAVQRRPILAQQSLNILVVSLLEMDVFSQSHPVQGT